MSKVFEKWKVLSLFLALFMVFGIYGTVKANEFAATNLTISSNIDITRGSGVGQADRVDFGAGTDNISIDSNGLNTDPSAFQVGGEIIIRAPEGMMWVLDTSASGVLTDATAADFAALHTLTGITVSPYTLILEQYTDLNGNLVNAVVGAKTTVMTVTDGTDAYDIDFDKGVGNDLTVVPIPALGAAPMNEKDKPFTVTVNGGTSAELVSNVGKVDVLKTPRLTRAVLVGVDAIDLYFDVDVDLTTVNQGAGLALTAGAGGSDFVCNIGGAADVSVSASNKRKVMLRNMTVLPASDGTDTINIDFANDFIDNDLGAWPGAPNAKQNRAVPIVPEGIAVTSVSADKTSVGCGVNGGFSYAANLKPDNSNKLVLTFQATGGAPFDFRIVSKDYGEFLEVDANNTIGVMNGYEIETPAGLVVADTDGDGTGDTVTVPAAVNTSGLVQLTVDFDSVAAHGLGVGEVGDIQIQASTDKFATKTTADVSLDRDPPAIVLSGDNKAKALTRTSVQFQFDEEMDRTACERRFVDNGIGGGVANNGVQDGAEESIYILRDITNGVNINVTGVAMAEDNKTVTLTTDLIPAAVNLQVRVLGLATGGADGTNREGAMDKAGNYITAVAGTYVNSNTFTSSIIELTSCTATNQATRRDFIADNGTLRTEVTGPANLGAVNIRAVDADNKTHILSTVPVAQATEVSEGVYRNTTMQLTTGITARAVIVQASTDATFSTGIIESNEVVIDNTRPKVASAAWVDDNHCTVTFDEPVLVAGAENGANYTIPGLQVSNVAQLDLNTEKTVTLTTTTMTTGTTYTVDVAAGVQDLAGNGINSAADAIGVDRAQFTAGVGPFSVSPDTVTVAAGATAEATATGGTAPYTVTSSDETVATATISDGTITITGVAEGSCTITVTDSTTPAQTAEISVTVTAAAAVEYPTLDLHLMDLGMSTENVYHFGDLMTPGTTPYIYTSVSSASDTPIDVYTKVTYPDARSAWVYEEGGVMIYHSYDSPAPEYSNEVCDELGVLSPILVWWFNPVFKDLTNTETGGYELPDGPYTWDIYVLPAGTSISSPADVEANSVGHETVILNLITDR